MFTVYIKTRGDTVPALLRSRSLEMVVHQVCGHYLNVTKDRAFMGGGKLLREFRSFRTKLEICLLNQVVDDFWGGFSPLSRDSQSDARNQRVESSYKLRPSALVVSLKAR